MSDWGAARSRQFELPWPLTGSQSANSWNGPGSADALKLPETQALAALVAEQVVAQPWSG